MSGIGFIQTPFSHACERVRAICPMQAIADRCTAFTTSLCMEKLPSLLSQEWCEFVI